MLGDACFTSITERASRRLELSARRIYSKYLICVENALSEDINKGITGDDDNNDVIDHNDKTTSPGEYWG